MTTSSSDPPPIDERLRAAAALGPEAWRRARSAVVARAEAEDLVDVAVERHDSPLGPILLAATREGVVRLGLPAEDEDAVLDELARRISGRVLHAPRAAVTDARRQLDEYFARARTSFQLPLDWRLTAGFRRRVLSVTAEIPYGRTASYTQVAARAGSPRAARAAGTALATNPVPIIIPCHRVLRTGGALGAYRGGLEAKAQLISLEAAGAS